MKNCKEQCKGLCSAFHDAHHPHMQIDLLKLLQLSDTFLGACLLEEFLCVCLAGKKYSQACRQQYPFQDNQ